MNIYISKSDMESAGKHWADARLLMCDPVAVPSQTEQKELREAVDNLIDHHKARDNWQEVEVLLQDVANLNNLSGGTAVDERATTQFELGEAYEKMRRWKEAIDSYSKALRLSTDDIWRAIAYEKLGDLYTVYQDPQTDATIERDESQEFLDELYKEALGVLERAETFHEDGGDYSGQVDRDEQQDQAEQFYEDAVKLYLEQRNRVKGLEVYEKLLHRMLLSEGGLMQLPAIFLRVLWRIPSEEAVWSLLADKSKDMLLKRGHPIEAADILVYLVRTEILGGFWNDVC